MIKLVLPPNLAPIQVVIVPIHKTDEQLAEITAEVNILIAELKKLHVSVKYDNRTTQKPGFKFAEWELKGCLSELRLDQRFRKRNFEVARRYFDKSEKSKDGIATYISDLLEEIQTDLFNKALNYRDSHITEVNSFEEFKSVLNDKGGFVSAHWDGTAATEEN
jgi:prolyl-tRNA synthetase